LSDTGGLIILSKPPGGPALYWHQDNMDWNHPKSVLPWPSTIFLSYYLVDTTRANGCLRVIPGTHRKRIPLHDQLPDAHGPEIQAADEDHLAFASHPDEIDIPVKAGDLVIADGRVLHAAWPNRSSERRPLILAWWRVFPFPSVPSWWTGEIPAELQAEVASEYVRTRRPGQYLR
jgi:ectoine hydroxylase-related dioxygenase (phytanoyl-CoA dioxygenase family)